MNTVTLSDGRQVPSDSEDWRMECLNRYESYHPDATHHAHLMNLRGIPGTLDRREYIEAVRRKEGNDAAERLKAAYLEVKGGKQA